MSTMMNDTMGAARNGIASAKERAEHVWGTASSGVASVQDGTGQAVLNAISMLKKGVSSAAGIVAMLRALDRDAGLAWFGLGRRSSTLGSIAIFGAGVAVGAGAGLLFAPMSGADMRRIVLGSARDLKHKVMDAVERAESEANGSASAQIGTEPGPERAPGPSSGN